MFLVTLTQTGYVSHVVVLIKSGAHTSGLRKVRTTEFKRQAVTQFTHSHVTFTPLLPSERRSPKTNCLMHSQLKALLSIMKHRA